MPGRPPGPSITRTAVASVVLAPVPAAGRRGLGRTSTDQRQEEAAGKPPAPSVDDISVTAAGPDRRVVTFVQRFGDDAVRKELTLQREAQGWRIVAERTLEKR